jgi:hypothetical protein
VPHTARPRNGAGGGDHTPFHRLFAPKPRTTIETTLIVRRLHEVIAALDARRPQPRRADEAAIARASAALRVRALDRLAELERASTVDPTREVP